MSAGNFHSLSWWRVTAPWCVSSPLSLVSLISRRCCFCHDEFLPEMRFSPPRFLFCVAATVIPLLNSLLPPRIRPILFRAGEAVLVSGRGTLRKERGSDAVCPAKVAPLLCPLWMASWVPSPLFLPSLCALGLVGSTGCVLPDGHHFVFACPVHGWRRRC